MAEPASAAQADASPGYVLLDDEGLCVGRRALRQARLRPRFVHSRFWDRLDTAPLARPFPQHLSHADLAHAHLRSVWAELSGKPAAAVLAVPGWYSSQQLGLLLGLARACEIPVKGMVDAGLAAAIGAVAEGKALHLDLQLHRAVLTELLPGPELLRGRVEVAEGAGLVAYRDSWAKGIADLFVQRTRFDPLHSAEVEQGLYDRLSGWLRQLQEQDSTQVEVETTRRHSVELTRERAVACVQSLHERLAQLVGTFKRLGEPATLLLSRRASLLPGLRARLAEFKDARMLVQESGAAALGALAHKNRILTAGEALPFVTRLPREGASSGLAAPEPASEPAEGTELARPGPAGPTPTHVLHEGQAHVIDDQALVMGVRVGSPGAGRALQLRGATAGISRRHCSIYRQADRVVLEDHSTYGSFLNDERVPGKTQLHAGDRLRLGSPGIELQLIRLADG